jgi:hypothetical protein
MQYTLIIGLEFQYYKRPAEVTISVNNKFIDSFELDRNHGSVEEPHLMFEKKWIRHFDLEKWPLRFVENKLSLPSFFKIYQINGEHLGGELEIKVSNANSDYTNGFMKNSSLIKFPTLALFPTVLAKKQGKKIIEMSARMDQAFWKKYLPRQTLEKRKQVSAYSQNRLPWPCCFFFDVHRENEAHSKNSVSSYSSWIGGSFTAKLNIQKKHKIFFLDQVNSRKKGFTKGDDPKTLAVCAYQPLLNIYDENH